MQKEPIKYKIIKNEEAFKFNSAKMHVVMKSRSRFLNNSKILPVDLELATEPLPQGEFSTL